MKNKELKKLVHRAHIEFSIDGYFRRNRIDNEDDQLRMKNLIRILSEMISEDTCIRNVNNYKFLYDVHEIPYYNKNWYIGINPEGTILAIGNDEFDVINQCENYVGFQNFANDKPKEWEPDCYCPVKTYSLN